ncbi:MAG: hypothetical protein RTV72_12220 [Candidatus Thorarchaeota archaeon]
MPSTQVIFEEIVNNNPNADINEIHGLVWERMQRYVRDYFARRVDTFLEPLTINDAAKRIVKDALLQPVVVGGVRYENFLVESGRRMSQSIQPRSGKSAELCGELALNREGLEKDVHYAVRDGRSDLTLHYPNIEDSEEIHRVEVKNMKIRERGVRGLAFDGDSLFGFFDSPGEFTVGEIEVIEESLETTGGYVYMPLDTLNIVQTETLAEPSVRLRSNTRFGSDMAVFVNTGELPDS